MQSHVDCECGNKIEKVGDQVITELYCPRCERLIVVRGTKGYYPQDEQQPSPQPDESSSSILAPDPHDRPDMEATVVECHYCERNRTPVVDSGTPRAASPSSANNSHISKYDLSQRVMHPIAKPVIPASPFSGRSTYGIHRILRVHQRGGMGRILVAYDQYLKREVAVKELHHDVAEDESIVRRFIGEAEITAQLEHPGIVPIHRLGQGQDGLPYYTMKMVRGETLQDAIKAYHRKPSKPELLNLVRRLVSVSKTIAFAHSKGVIHRDLKPANVMIGEHGETLVMDWGLAKMYGKILEESYVSIVHQTKQERPELTIVGSIVGTPAFMSPEQASPEGAIVGPLSDIFALGTVLYYLLAGQTAFTGRSTQEVLSKVRACQPIPPSQLKSTVPPGLEAICLKAMEKLPENRYQCASEFADDLCRWLDDEPIHAMKDTLFSRIRRRLFQQQVSLFGVICAFIVLSVLAGIGMWVAASSQHQPAGNDAGGGLEIKVRHDNGLGQAYFTTAFDHCG